MKKVLLCGVLILSMVLGVTAQAMAPKSDYQVSYSEVFLIGASLSISGNTAQCGGFVEPQKSGVKSTVTVRLQKWNGQSWDTIATWSGSGTSLLGASAGGSKTLTAVGTYRVWTTGTCGSETVQKYSGEKHYV